MKLRVNQNGFPVLDQFSEDGFVDCVLKITDLEENEDFLKFYLRASYDENDLGFGVEVVKGIKSGLDAEMALIRAHVYKQGVRFYRTGSDSDRLLSVLASLYGFGKSSLRMTEVETFSVIALHQGDIDMLSDPIKIKLFGKDEDDNLEENYYESFFNLDLKNGFVFWNEKDPDYREPLIRGLSK